ncbi:hypothetical protein BS50DRAFT_395298 [Corynespora cassiicola Philippines]|uniref:Uncharacterized protein n=1 Tax=Corynespora cassiicola Philippines TaxID=1448308 RepID=A0A2T2MZW2_CORCC|nr:hypothetical protein BS50DRAFT_395298 [Corynespora cassiicola Philippines]
MPPKARGMIHSIIEQMSRPERKQYLGLVQSSSSQRTAQRDGHRRFAAKRSQSLISRRNSTHKYRTWIESRNSANDQSSALYASENLVSPAESLVTQADQDDWRLHETRSEKSGLVDVDDDKAEPGAEDNAGLKGSSTRVHKIRRVLWVADLLFSGYMAYTRQDSNSLSYF